MNDRTAISTYSQFRKYRKNIGYKYPYAEYDKIQNATGHKIGFSPFLQYSKEHSRELANSINEFTRYLYDLESWTLLLKSKKQDIVWDIILEFINPICYYCLGFPYAIKQKICNSIAEISHQANRYLLSTWRDNVNLTNTNFKIAQKHAKYWKSWPALCTALAEVNSDAYIKITNDFRNTFNHGFPRNIEIGITLKLKREVINSRKTAYHFGPEGPLKLSNLLPHIAKQHNFVITCFYKYIELIKEQYEHINLKAG